MAITHDGRALVVVYPNLGEAQAYGLNASTGAMTAIGSPLDFNSAVSSCASTGCFPTGVDVDNTDTNWVFGNAVITPSILTAKANNHGFTSAALVTFNSSLTNVETPWFSPAGRAGNGNLYIGASGFGSFYPGGIIVCTYNNGAITYVGSTNGNGAAYYAGNVQSIGSSGTGSPITQIWSDGSANNTVQSYTVSGTTLTPASSLKTSSSGSFAFSTNGVSH